tara:strand:- start:13006 stop:14337 length:1332 start_codon:yes stop_codon:yes gene_type:complete
LNKISGISSSIYSNHPIRIIVNRFKKNGLEYFSIFVLLFSVLRGLIPIFTRNASLAQPSYSFSFLAGLILSFYGIYSCFILKNNEMYKGIRTLLILNLILTIYWILPLLILIPSFNLLMDTAYKCWFIFSIYAFYKVPEEKIILAFKIISIFVGGFIFIDFISLNTSLIPNGYDSTMARYRLLRSDFPDILSRTAIFYRPKGILGAGILPHDSGNLLAILSCYWIAMNYRYQKRDNSIFLLSIFCTFCLILSQSVTNLIVAFFCIMIIFLSYYKKFFSFSNISKTLVLVIPFISWIVIKFSENIKLLGILWSGRVVNADWKGMTRFFGDSTIMDNLYSFFFGYGHLLNLSEIADLTELALVKILFEYGFFHASIFLGLLIAPMFIYLFKGQKKNRKYFFPYFIAILVSFLSLMHYGSILRTTNIFVFLAMYSQLLKMYFVEKT